MRKRWSPFTLSGSQCDPPVINQIVPWDGILYTVVDVVYNKQGQQRLPVSLLLKPTSGLLITVPFHQWYLGIIGWVLRTARV